MITSAESKGLVLPLIEGLAAVQPWGLFLERLRESIDADYASIIFRPEPKGPIVHLASGAQSPPILARLYRESLHRDDPLPYFQLVEGRVYETGELLRADNPTHEDFRRRLLEPSGMNMLLMQRLTEPAGTSAWLSVSRRTGCFSFRARKVLEGLAPYLRAALGAHIMLERDRMRAALADDVARRMNFGWLTLDRDGRVVDADHLAETMFSQAHTLLRTRSGHLTARTAEVANEINRAVRAMATEHQPRPRAIVRPVRG